MRAPGGFGKLPVGGLEDVRSKEGPTKVQKGFGKPPAGQPGGCKLLIFHLFLQCFHVLHVCSVCWSCCGRLLAPVLS